MVAIPNVISKLAENLSISDSPWQFKLLAMLVIFFFSGGLMLDYWASTVTVAELSGTLDSRDLDQMIIDFTKQKHAALTGSASLLYDFAKIALGALIASVTQGLKPQTTAADSGTGAGA
ncbi:hypothetical protein DV711_02905 [Motiliproteus coralliicola]|uniref:Uncharacterized protein n=1 Tax=Motiliproteus coralliicola TaxID=2283196 RepID=A0A369WVH5_9GAMM|nr:hypothetical protein [Motiliproteus coralliicola]RDE24554.1 hypothetical protein DV711_02905 [Motiliproteus coralliicola]